MLAYNKHPFSIQDCLLWFKILLLYVTFSQSTGLKCYISEPVPNNASIEVLPEECHSAMVSCMNTIDWGSNITSFFCSAKNCSTEIGAVNNTFGCYNTTNDLQINCCCYTDGCNLNSTSHTFKLTSSILIAITLICITY